MASATDNFNRANETPLAGNWTDISQPFHQFNLVTNSVTCSAFDNDCESIYNAGSFGADQYSEAALSVTGTPGGDQGAGVTVRSVGPAATRTEYRLIVDHAASNNVTLSKFISGAKTALTTFTSAFTNGDVWRLEVSGSNITIKRNGSTVSTVTDSSVTTGQPGITYSSTVSGATIDDWAGGDLAPVVLFPQLITPMSMKAGR